MKKVLCVFLCMLFLFSNAVAEVDVWMYEEMLTGTWVTMVSEWNRDVLPGSFSYPSDDILVTYSPSGAAFVHFYYAYDDGIDKTEMARKYELTFAASGNVIALNDAYGSSTIYEKIEGGSIVGGSWSSDYYVDNYREDSIGHINLYGVMLSFMNDGKAVMTLTLGNPRYEGYNEEEYDAVWTLEEDVLIVETELEGFETMQGYFDGSVIDFSESVSDLYFSRS